MPALLSMVGTAWWLFVLSALIWALLFPQPPPEGSVGPNFGPFLIIPLIGVFGILWLIPMTLSVLLLRDTHRHRQWGLSLTFWSGLASAYLNAGALSSVFSYNVHFDPWLTALALTPLLGVVGGLWGIVWHTGRTRLDFERTMTGPPGRVLIGGLVVFFSTATLSGFLAILFLPAFVMVVCGVLLFLTRSNRRALGAVVLVACVFFGLLLPGSLLELGGNPVSWYYGVAVVVSAMLVGVGLAVSGAVATIRQRAGFGPQSKGEDQPRKWFWQPPEGS